jgi:hypothetical protein
MSYFGFEDINILFYDSEQDNLYTITFEDDEDHYISLKIKLKNAKNEKERETILALESMNDVTLKGNQMMNFSTQLGITSLVFKNQKTEMINEFKPSKNFNFL